MDSRLKPIREQHLLIFLLQAKNENVKGIRSGKSKKR
jgi:hypothetical protein